MRRRRRETVQSFATETLTAKVGKLMDSRRRLLAPFPLVPEKIYRAAWTPEERTALKVCAKHKDLLKMGSTLQVILPTMVGTDHAKATITIKLNQALPMPGYVLSVPYDNLSFEQVHALHEWVPKWAELNMQQISLVAKVKEVGKVCKTYGQLHRLWPDILSFFNDVGSRTVMSARARSPYPREVMQPRYVRNKDDGFEVVGDIALRPEFTPEAFAPFTSMIAECLMLPENEDKEVASVTIVRC